MATLATLSVIALVAVGTWQIYKAVAGSGSEVRAENPASEGVAQARTPFGGIDWQAPPVSAEASAEKKDKKLTFKTQKDSFKIWKDK